ncbi:hypothetical protein M422DRAFT_265581 [Sphaerobolus stellatus SS14]|uniref:Uncharacterized protein n=1 Tax=Sphaerobolus stellatus (strain SS14) TaxID=990650 RepID=A0A0C9UCW7_SPHS4|nr:hypothetical protein M422DRAFT_265581 [Sphaerobolus stellatus SS14]
MTRPVLCLHADVSKDKDGLLPAREFGDTRVATEGFANACIIRAILFRTEAARQGHVNFPSLDSWSTFVDGHDERFYFNPKAYGNNTKQRLSTNGPIFFESGHYWEEFLASYQGDKKPSFRTTFDWIRTRGAKLPGIGDLTAYLLAGDYVYAGVVMEPEVNEVAYAIYTLKAGAWAGLIHLGILAEREGNRNHKKDTTAIQSALEQIMCHMKNVFTKDERAQMKWDLIMLEHSLCKLKRLKDRVMACI